MIPLLNTFHALQPSEDGMYELRISEEVRQQIVTALSDSSEAEEQNGLRQESLHNLKFLLAYEGHCLTADGKRTLERAIAVLSSYVPPESK